MNQKEHLVYKIVIDVYGSYLKQFDNPDSKLYQEEYLPLAIDFYSRMTAENLTEMHDSLSQLLSNELIKLFVQKKGTLKDYINYFESEMISSANLTGGNNLS